MEAKPKTLVTGASSGIGRATVLKLVERGHSVVGIARDFTRFGREDVSFERVFLDLSDLGALPENLAALARQHPDVEALVCCAGRGDFGSLEEFSYQRIRELVELNFLSPAYLVRAFLPSLKKRGRGDLIFLGSESALSGGKRGAVYAASKAALGGFARALREECGKSGVRVSVIHPGMVRTEFFDDLPFAPGEDEANYLLPEEVAELVVHILAARPGAVFDEIHLSPLKKVLRFRSPERDQT
jgi:short-subunit dehydrogenase